MQSDIAPAAGKSEPPVVATPVQASAPASPPPVVHDPLRAASVAIDEPSEIAGETVHIAPGLVLPKADEVVSSGASTAELLVEATGRLDRLRWYQWPGWLCCRVLDLISLLVLLAVVAAVPIVQLASLGYLLHAAGNLAQGRPWSTALPGLRLAGKIGTFFLLSALLWLPVFLVTDLAYSAQLLQPGSAASRGWRMASFVVTALWVTHVAWGAFRGGRWWHLMWPAPWKFLRTIWRPSAWQHASDQLYETVAALRFPQLWWLGARCAAATLVLLAVPVSMMIIGQRAEELNAAGLVGLVGALGMLLLMLYLPFAQIQLAAENRLTAIFDWRSVRRRFRHAPVAHALALLVLCLLCIPLYLLRIEATPAELVWAPSLVFVAFTLPAKLLLGGAMGYAETRRDRRQRPVRGWWLRWPSRGIALASVLIYVGSLYVAQLVAGQGAYVMYFQHALLVPAPLISS